MKRLILLATIALSACGWHFKNNEMLPQELRTLTFESADPHSEIARTLRQQLQLNDVKLVPAQADVTKLRLIGASNDSKVVSVFKQAREAEKQLSLNVQAIVSVPNKGDYPIEATVHRTFFDDSRAALAKSNEQEMIMKDMYEYAARQLIVKMSGLHQEINQAK